MESSDTVTNELIGLIYETAQDPNLWPVLLSGVFSAINEEVSTNVPLHRQQKKEEIHFSINKSITHLNLDKNMGIYQELTGILIPHFQRALRINKQLAEYKEERENTTNILELLPLGVLMVNKDGAVIYMNHRARKMVEVGPCLGILNSRLTTIDTKTTSKLYQLIRSATNNDVSLQETGTLSFKNNGIRSPVSILVTPVKNEFSSTINGNLCNIFVATTDKQYSISLETLIDLYQLTPAEARTTQLLANGKSIEETSNELNISPHTVKTQLRSVFHKTGTHRQAELVSHILTGPAVVLNKQTNVLQGAIKASVSPTFHNKKFEEGDLTLSDGRNLSYAEYGDKYGKPVLFFHNSLASRLQGPPDSANPSELGIRLINPDRPGFGRSTHLQNRTLRSWTEDIAQLADHLGLKKFYVAGNSSGGAYAAACAYYLPNRCVRLGLISSMVPFNSITELKGMRSSEKLLLGLARHSPPLLIPFLRVLANSVIKNPKNLIHKFTSHWTESDMRLLNNPHVTQEMTDCLSEAIINGAEGVFSENFILAKLWGFELCDIQIETLTWHGQSDTVVPIDIAQKLVEIPNNTFCTFPNEGHLTIIEHWREIFTTLVQ